MLGPVDHVGYVVRDLDAAVTGAFAPYGLAVVLEFALPQYAVRGVYLRGGEALVELFSFTDPQLAAARLAGQDVRLDHVAHAVDDIDAAARRLRAAGVGFRAPDGRPLDAPVELGGRRHLWTVPEAPEAICVQLIGAGA